MKALLLTLAAAAIAAPVAAKAHHPEPTAAEMQAIQEGCAMVAAFGPCCIEASLARRQRNWEQAVERLSCTYEECGGNDPGRVLDLPTGLPVYVRIVK